MCMKRAGGNKSMSYSTKDAYSLIEKGEYELQITQMTINVSTSGKEYLAIRFKIRDDVEQKFKNRIIFENIWHEKDNPEYFNRKRIGSLLGTQADDISAESIEEVMEIMEGAYLIGVVDIVHNDYVGADENRIKYFKKSKVGEQTLTDPKEDEVTVEISSDIFPF